MRPKIGIDEAGIKKVEVLVDSVRATGLTEAAEMFSTVYWAWLRLTESYTFAIPYVEKPEPGGMTPYSALTVPNFTLNHWGPQIPGTPSIDNDAVRKDAAVDEEWHRQEDRRMRRAAGEPI